MYCVCVIGTEVNQSFQVDLSEPSPSSKHAPNTKKTWEQIKNPSKWNNEHF